MTIEDLQVGDAMIITGETIGTKRYLAVSINRDFFNDSKERYGLINLDTSVLEWESDELVRCYELALGEDPEATVVDKYIKRENLTVVASNR